MSIDARFHAEAVARRVAAAQEAKRKATRAKHLRQIRASYGKSTNIDIIGDIGNRDGEISARIIKSQLPSPQSSVHLTQIS